MNTSTVHMNWPIKVDEVKIVYQTTTKPSERMKVISSHDAYKIFNYAYEEGVMDYRERFYVMYLNRANRVLGIHKISEGGISGTVVDIRMLFQGALKANACSIIVCHNHPSGNLTPSDNDNALIKKIVQAGKVLDIKLTDSLILTSETYYSWADEGLL